MVLRFEAFIDDSYSTDEFVLAGHIAPAEAWAAFSKEWEELLPLGTRTKNGKFHFKMSEMAQFPDRMKRVPASYALIEKYVTLSVSVRLNLLEFRRAHEITKTKLSHIGLAPDYGKWCNPFVMAFKGLMDEFHLSRSEDAIKGKIPIDAKVDFIFDDQSEKKFLLREWEDYLSKREEARSLFSSHPRFENDQEFLPLQAADLWAWWVREWYEEDASVYPDKMRAFDFGAWQGKSRSVLAMSFTEKSLVEMLETLGIEGAYQAIEDRSFTRASWLSRYFGN